MSVLGFARTFSSPFATGSGTTFLVPHKFDVGIGGYGYMLDRKLLASGNFALVSSIRATRAQSDQSQEPGEQSLNPDDLWRRTQQTWHLGAGQEYLDRDDSSRKRFRTSKGIDCWTEGQLTLLNDTERVLTATGANLLLMPAGSRLYAVDGTDLKFTADLSAWTTVSGTSGSAITGIASDGYSVWVADGSDVYVTNTGSSAASSWSTRDVDVLGYVKGRLMFSDGPAIGYFSSMSGPTATVLFTHAAPTFTWVGFAEGPGNIYAAGYAGDKSLVYRVAITREGTSLDAPIVAGELPDGEIIHSIGSYLGFIFLGTSRGARFCTLDGQGNLNIGAVIVTPQPVKCFEGQGEFVWFGMTAFDGSSTGLGRMSLRKFAEPEALKPAHASDLMASGSGTVVDVVTFAEKRVFSVAASGVWAQATDLVPSGSISCGRLNYGITEKKIPLYLDVTFAAGFTGKVTAQYATNGQDVFSGVGSHTTASVDLVTDTFSVTENQVDQVEVGFVVERGSNPEAGPTILRWTLRSQPVPKLRRKVTLPVLIHNSIRAKNGVVAYDPLVELARFSAWRDTKQVLAVQIGNDLLAGIVEDFDFIAMQTSEHQDYWQGSCILSVKTV